MALKTDEVIVIAAGVGLLLFWVILASTLSKFRSPSVSILMLLILGSLGAVFYGIHEDKSNLWWIIPTVVIGLCLIGVVYLVNRRGATVSGEEDGSDEFVVVESEAQLAETDLKRTAEKRGKISSFVRDEGSEYAPKVKEFLSTISYGAPAEKVAELDSKLSREEVEKLESIRGDEMPTILTLPSTKPVGKPKFGGNGYYFTNNDKNVMILLN